MASRFRRRGQQHHREPRQCAVRAWTTTPQGAGGGLAMRARTAHLSKEPGVVMHRRDRRVDADVARRVAAARAVDVQPDEVAVRDDGERLVVRARPALAAQRKARGERRRALIPRLGKRVRRERREARLAQRRRRHRAPERLGRGLAPAVSGVAVGRRAHRDHELHTLGMAVICACPTKRSRRSDRVAINIYLVVMSHATTASA